MNSLCVLRRASLAFIFWIAAALPSSPAICNVVVVIDERSELPVQSVLNGLELRLDEGRSGKIVPGGQPIRRWQVSESAPAAGSESPVQNPSVWVLYKKQILTILTVVLLQAVLIIWLIYEHRQRHIAEVAVRNTMSELAHMNRVATAGELSASIAHEINQPLTAVTAGASAALHWLEKEAPDIAEARSALVQVISQSHRASEIMTNLRAMFKKEAQDKSAVDINTVILDVLQLLRIELLKYGVEVQTELGAQLPPVTGLEIQLQQVVLNLAANAIEAMHYQSSPRLLRLRSELIDSDKIQVSIEDSGTGIAPPDLDHVFKPLFSTKAAGMGMGLSICRSIIEGHDGKIWASAGRQRGTVFHFSLPVI
jgi:C4-dicarboxylate-specific signal transduction histidine kinase